MQYLLKNNIRFINVHIQEGAKIEVSTNTPPQSGTSFKKMLPEICFGVNDINDSSHFIPAYHEIAGGGQILEIYTQYDERYDVFKYKPGMFKIFLPPDCTLHFIYSD